MGFITVCLLGLVLATVLWMIVKRLTSKKLRLPPAPEESLPLLGHLFTFLQRPEVESNDDFYLNKVSAKLGDVYMLNLAGTFAYIVSNQELAKTALTHPNTQNRPSNKSHKRAFGPRARGIILCDGEQWKTIRKFILELFRHLGVGRARFEDVITAETDRLVVDLNNSADKEPIPDLLHRIQRAIMNIVSGIILGKQFDYDDPAFKDMLHIIESYLRLTGPSGPDSFALLLPFGRGAELRQCMAEFKKLCEDTVKDHTGVTEHGTQSDFVGAFLKEMDQRSDDKDECFNLENLMACCLDMFVAGVDTVASGLTYTIMCITTHPEVQERCYEEIDKMIGRDRKPTFADKDKLPYLQAVISESLRIANVAPFGAPHVAEKDLEMFGYDVPKGTMFIVNYGGIFFNEENYPDPKLFQPERFMEDGVYKKDPDFFPFSVGSRACPGEQLARMELYLFVSRLLQQFRFEVPDGSETPNIHLGTSGGTRSPLPYPVNIVKRS